MHSLHNFRCLALFLCSALICLLPPARAQDAPRGRPQLPLNGDWQYQFLPEASSKPEQKWSPKPIKLPGLTQFPKTGQKLLLAERRVLIPADWANRKVALCISHPLIGVAAEINGQPAGEVPGFGGELDITALTHPGQENVIRLKFFRAGNGLATLDDYTRECIPSLKAGIGDRGGLLGQPEGFYLESRSPELTVSDVWYRTFTRTMPRLEPQITLINHTATGPLNCTVEITDSTTNKPVLTKTFPVAMLPAGTTELNEILPASKLQMWWPNAPKLYRGQVIITDASGREIDRSNPVLFGFREVWAQGKQFYLNNAPVHFTLDAYFFPDKDLEKCIKDELAAGITLTYGHHGATGTAISHDHEDWANICDRLGMGLISWGVSVGIGGADLGKPAILNAYRRWTEAHLRRIRNHPSILFLCLSTNFTGGSDSPEIVGNTQKMRWNHRDAGLSYLTHRALDPTRLYFHHAGQGVGDFDTSNTYSNHLPHQEIDDWLSEYEKKGDRPYMVVEFNGVPLDVDYVKHYSNFPLVSYVTEYAARLAGDRAYAAEQPDYRTYSTYMVPRLKSVWNVESFGYSPFLVAQNAAGMREVTLACRFRKVATDLWIWQPDAKKLPDPTDPRRINKQALADAALALQAPLHCWIGGPADNWTEKGHNFYSGEQIQKSLLVIDDRRMNAIPQVAAVWEAKFRDTGEVAASGDSRETGEIPSPWYARLKIPLNFTAPAVTQPREIELSARLLDGKSSAELSKASFNLTVYPRPAQTTAAAPQSLAIIDPSGETAALLAKYNIKTVADTPDARKAGGGLVLGRGALDGMNTLPFTAEEIANGLRVYVFEQHNDAPGRFGLRYEAHSPRVAFPRQRTHPLMQGLTEENLHDWRGASTLVSWGPERDGNANSRRTHHWSNRGTVASVMLETPHFGAFRALADMEFDLAYTPLLQWRHGKGEIIFCQFDVTARTAIDPAVDLFLHNFSQYSAAPLSGPAQDKTIACADASLRKTLDKLGFATADNAEASDALRTIIAVDGSRPLDAKSADFARNGGTVLAIGVQTAFLKQPEFTGLTCEQTTLNSVRMDQPEEPLLAGIGPQNLHWREPLTFTTLKGSTEGGKILLNGLLGEIQFGKGRVILLQVTDDVLTDTTAVKSGDQPKGDEKALSDSWFRKNRNRSIWQGNRMRSLILANLGAISSPELVKGFFSPQRPLPFMPIDKWIYLGPIPAPQDKEGDPLNLDLAQLLKNRNADQPTPYNGKALRWITPTDVNNGLGLGGFMNLATVFSAVERQGCVAVTHIWSSDDRTATLQVGADWWLRVQVNGQEVFRTGTVDGFSGMKFAKGFGFNIRAPLKKGWNEVVCLTGSGSNGNGFWFQISNPGDVVAEPSLATPAEAPWLFLRFARGSGTRQPDKSLLQEDNSGIPSFSLYTEPLSVHDDPYLFMRW